AAPLDPTAAAAMGRQQHHRRGLRMVGDVLNCEHAAVAVTDNDWVRETSLCEPGGGVAVIGDALARELKRGAFGRAAVPDAENVMAAPVEGEANETEARQHGRQEARCTDIEVHRVAVKQ